ncbi:hypothetical protein IEO21_06568 [Rhodonia placenta]|uniref:Uncharacterized protein n=1 Tax=Rhodonia placenta TaxID=104341 RepID=A0A8H7P089_9APHY|nr:hypothetical protein IEO21_06568 [Postia placenta]
MLNRTAGTLGRSATTPLSPSLLKLDPEQRVRLIRSSQKVGRVLGATPVIDVVSPTAVTFTPPPLTTPGTARTPLGNVKSLFAQHSPVTFGSAASKASAREETLNSPVVQYKIHVDSKSTTRIDSPKAAAARPTANGLRRKHVPAALPLPQAQRTEALPLSPFRYGMLRSVHSPALSPLSPVSPMSPITEAKIEQSKRDKLERLEQLAQCASIGVPQEVVYPSFGQMEEKAEQITSFLDLYRMRARDDSSLFKASDSKTSAVDEPAQGLLAESKDGARSRRITRASTEFSLQKRRSRSVGDFHSFGEALALQSPRFALQSPRFAVQQDRHLTTTPRSPAYAAAPPPTALSATSALVSPSIYSQISAEEGDVPVLIPSPPTSPGLRRKRSLARAKASIIGADALLMARFRTGFGTRPLDFAVPSLPAPTGPLPSPPVSPAIADVRSPRAPYWVRRSFRPRDSLQALHLIEPPAAPVRPKRSSRGDGRATPRTLRFERRMGWGGQWNQGSLAGAIDTLKDLQ